MYNHLKNLEKNIKINLDCKNQIINQNENIAKLLVFLEHEGFEMIYDN